MGWTMSKFVSRVSVSMVAGAALVVLAASPAAAAAEPNPVTGCVGANNMMPAPGMSTQGWAALPDSNPGIGPSVNGMVTAMIVSDPYWDGTYYGMCPGA